MAIKSSRSEIIVGATQSRRSGLIEMVSNGAGETIESNEQVAIADLSTQVFGRAKGDTAASAAKLPMAANDREDNTGV